MSSSAEEKTTPRLKDKAIPVFAQIQINKASTAHAHLYCFEPGIRSHGNRFWLLGSLLLPRQLVQLFWALFFLIKRKKFHCLSSFSTKPTFSRSFFSHTTQYGRANRRGRAAGTLNYIQLLSYLEELCYGSLQPSCWQHMKNLDLN